MRYFGLPELECFGSWSPGLIRLIFMRTNSLMTEKCSTVLTKWCYFSSAILHWYWTDRAFVFFTFFFHYTFHPIQQSINHSINQSINQSVNQSICHCNNYLLNCSPTMYWDLLVSQNKKLVAIRAMCSNVSWNHNLPLIHCADIVTNSESPLSICKTRYFPFGT